MPGARNWFDAGGQSYARYRPSYPQSLAAALAEVAHRRGLAVDVGCGNGQLTRMLAGYFTQVVGLDPSADQIANAAGHKGVRYAMAPAEHTGLVAGCADLITAAQAAHWFDLPRFYDEARRIAAPGCLIALISYGVPKLPSSLNPRFQTFYHDEIGSYWPPERRLVDEGYATIPFPFPERPFPTLRIERRWSLPQFLGYIGTWSAVRRAREAGRDDLLDRFCRDLQTLWDNADQRCTITWPVTVRLGRGA